MTDITARLRQTRADMTGTDDEQHYWGRHDAVAEIERLRNGSLEGREMEHKEPVAWAILHRDHQYVSLLREHAEAHNVYVDAEVVPLYRQPQPTLTAGEREAIRRAEARLRTAYVPDDETAATLRSLLKRLA